MSKGFYRELTGKLKAHGCTWVRNGKGDHEIWFSPLNGRTFPVDGVVVSKNLANAVLKQAGIEKAERF